MGSAYARIIGEGGEEEEDEAGEGLSAGDLLCYSSGSFMVFTAMINLINKDPVGENAPELSSLNRGIIRSMAGFAIWSLAFFISDEDESKSDRAAIIVPVLALVATSIEVWAVKSLKVAI
uniref:Uncharacterized protein n=1 Tax=Corethron hystrix TaxID=216773 RepID=A0A7S1BQE0_9STRA